MKYFLVYLFIEVIVSVNISSYIGALSTFVAIVATALVGFALFANFRNTFMQSLSALQNRTISIQEFQKLNAFALLGAFLLIVPGFFSDIVGLFLQFGFFATLFGKKVLRAKDSISERENIKGTDSEIIDVEVIEKRD